VPQVSAFERRRYPESCGSFTNLANLRNGIGTEEDIEACKTNEEYVTKGGSRGCTETGELFDDPPACEKKKCSEFSAGTSSSRSDCPSGEWEPHYECQVCIFEAAWGNDKKCSDRGAPCTRNTTQTGVPESCGEWSRASSALKSGTYTEEDVRLCATPKYQLVSGGDYKCNGGDLAEPPESPSTCKELKCSDFTRTDCPKADWEPHYECQVCEDPAKGWGSDRSKCSDRSAPCTW